jgi:DHA1 family purine base/nucleoside efflux pump-like MFS transporter
VRLGPLLALTLATFALGFGELMIAGILPDVARGLHVTLSAGGSLVGVYSLAFAAVSPALAVALGRIERRAGLVGALLLVAAANAGAAFGGDLTTVLAMRVAAAIGSAAATTLALASVDSFADEPSRGRAHGIVFAGFSAAATLGVPLGVVIADRAGWRTTFGCVALSALVAALLVALTVRRMPRGAPLGWRDLRALLAHRPLQTTIAVSLLDLSATYAVFTYIRPLFDATGRFDATLAAALLFLYGAMGVVGNLLGGVLVDRFGSRRGIVACLAATALVVLSFPLTLRTLPGAIVAIGVWSLVSWGFAPAVNRQLAADAQAAPEFGLALNLTAFNLGIALGSTAGGIVLADAGALAIPPFAAAIFAAACAVALSARRARPAAAT